MLQWLPIFFNQTRSHHHQVSRKQKASRILPLAFIIAEKWLTKYFFFLHGLLIRLIFTNEHNVCILKPKYNCQKQKVKQTINKLHGHHKAYLDSSSLHFPWTLESSLHYYKHADAVWVVSKLVFLLRWLCIYGVDPSSIAGLWGPFLVPSPTLLSCLFLSPLCSLQE